MTTWGEQEFEALFRRVYPRLLRASELCLAERPAAEDCAQEAFARLLARGMMPADDAERWVFRVGRNLAVDRLRHVRRIAPLSEGAEGPSRPAAPGADGRLAALRTAVSELSSHQREVVALRIYGELSYEEIATAVGRSLGSVKQELHRAKLVLKARLNGMDLEDVDG